MFIKSVSLLVILLKLWICQCSLFDPHVFPETGPFFEGWYARVTDFENQSSFGILFGSVLPLSPEEATGPLAQASFLYRKCDNENTCQLYSAVTNFTLEDLNITVNGKPVTRNPDRQSLSSFKWQGYNTDGKGGFFEQNGGKTTLKFSIGDISISVEAHDPEPWNKDGFGPEGYLGLLPLPLHWFVFSVRSRVNMYTIRNMTSGDVLQEGTGTVHLEKNWGESFPKKWIWSEGVAQNPTNVSFALSGGQVDFSIASVIAYLIGYRNPAADIEIDFRPDNSIIETIIDGCTGQVNISATSWLYKMEAHLIGNDQTFSQCLLGPEVNGFMPACVESYDASASIEIYRRKWLSFDYVMVDQQLLGHIALEFGGTNVCGNKCDVH